MLMESQNKWIEAYFLQHLRTFFEPIPRFAAATCVADCASRLPPTGNSSELRLAPQHRPPSQARQTGRGPVAWHRATVRYRRATALSSESRHARGTRRRHRRTDRDRGFPAPTKTNLACLCACRCDQWQSRSARLLGSVSSSLQNLEHPGKCGRIDAGVNDHTAIFTDDNDHLPARPGGRHRWSFGRDNQRWHKGSVLRVRSFGVQPKRAPPGHQQRARYAVPSCCRRYRPGRLQALQDDPELLVIRPVPTPPSLNKLQPFNLSTVLMAVHKHCYTSLKPTKQGGPRRRETLEGTEALFSNQARPQFGGRRRKWGNM